MRNVNTLLVLKADAVVEPLVGRWHAWPHLVAPATAALNIAHKHLALLESFVSAPDVHAAACKNPSLRGGPFVDLPPEQVEAVKQLIQDTKINRAAQIQFGMDLREAQRTIMKLGDGFSLEHHYQSLSDSVRGYLELTYSPMGFANVKVLESLLYRRGRHYPEFQTAMLYLAKGDERPFAFSTPRLRTAQALEITQPFHSSVYDYLAKLRTCGSPFEEIVQTLGVNESKKDLLKSFLCEPSATRLEHAAAPKKTRWRYFGHACVLVETAAGINVLVDPIIAYEADLLLPRFTLADLPEKIDYVVFTHTHADHVVIETLLAIRYKVDTVVVPANGGQMADPSLKLLLESIGFEKVISLNALESETLADLTLTALPFLGEHGNLDIQSKAAWLVQSGNDKLLFAADSNNLEPRIYQFIHDAFGDIDSLFIGMECLGAPFSWTYGPLLPMAIDRKKDQSRRLDGSDFERGMKVVEALGCKNVYVYAMGAEPWIQYVTSIDPSEDTAPAINAKQLIEKCQSIGLNAVRLYGSAQVVLA
ncbi:MAG: hypothetical protein CK528_09495 [Alcaligenaceae bacterium]|nr:MAG: hypothetical protein CK528_09495 [Alcaligenaceae bacterium]